MKVSTNTEYTPGTKLQDNDTKETFIVTDCSRVIIDGVYKFALTLDNIEYFNVQTEEY